MALPKFVCYPNSHKFRTHKGRPGPGLLIHNNELKEPTADIREVLMGFRMRDTAAPGLSEEQRRHLLGQCIDINLLTWLMRETTQPAPHQHQPPNATTRTAIAPLTLSQFAPGTFNRTPDNPLTQPPPDLSNRPCLRLNTPAPPHHEEPPDPIAWAPLWTPEQWVYTDGSKIDPNPKLGAAVIHPATSTVILIDATGLEENNTVLRAELVAIHQALITFEADPDLNIATDSLTALQILHALITNPASRPHSPHKHLLEAIITTIQSRDNRGYTTVLRKIRSHTGIRGNEKADTTAKRVILEEDTLPKGLVIRHTLGAHPYRPTFWLHYQCPTPTPSPSTATGLCSTSNRPPPQSLSEEDLGYTQAFTNPSKQFRKRVKPRVLTSLYHTSIYRRLILQASKDGARLATTASQITKRRTPYPTQATQLLQFLWGQLFNGKIAHRYGL